MSPKLRVARFTKTLWQLYDLHKIQLTNKQALSERKYFTGCLPLLTPNHCLRTCGGLEAFTSTTLCKKCGGKTSSGGLERYILKDHQAILPIAMKYCLMSFYCQPLSLFAPMKSVICMYGSGVLRSKQDFHWLDADWFCSFDWLE